jgi:hypothetical protein
MVHITLPLRHSSSPSTAFLLAVSTPNHSRDLGTVKTQGYIVVEASHPIVANDACSSR